MRGLAAHTGRSTYHRGMGEKQIRAKAAQAGADALQPQFDALGDLAVAAEAAANADAVRAAAKVKAQQIIDDAEAEVARRFDRWREAWQNARNAGWTVERLRAAPISQQQPPAAPKKKLAAKRSDASTSGRSAPSEGPATSGTDPAAVQELDPPHAHTA